MKQSGFKFIWLVCLAIVVSPSAFADTITIAADEWSPYNGVPGSPEPGYGIEIARRVFESAGHTVKYVSVPWTRAIKETRNGAYNAVIGATKTETPDFVFPREEFGVSKNSFFVKDGTQWRYTGKESLLTIKLGAVKNYSYGKEIDAFLKANPNIVEYLHGEDPLLLNIRKLLMDRIDALIEDPNVLAEKAKKMGVLDQIVIAGDTGRGDILYIAFSPEIKASKEYARIFTNGIRKMRKSGELDAILDRYGLSDWK